MSTPTAFAAASAASAFITLWRPSSGQRTSPTSRAVHATTVEAAACRPRVDAARAVQRVIAARRRPKRLDRRPATHRQHFGQVRVLAIDDQPAATRHGAHEVMELALDRGDVGKDVGVVVFEVVEDRDQRPVVDELAALVEERGVVFVGLDHELARRCPRAPTRRNPRRRRRSGSPARARPPAAARSGSWSSWSCRGCRRRRACRGPAARVRASHCAPDV